MPPFAKLVTSLREFFLISVFEIKILLFAFLEFAHMFAILINNNSVYIMLNQLLKSLSKALTSVIQIFDSPYLYHTSSNDIVVVTFQLLPISVLTHGG